MSRISGEGAPARQVLVDEVGAQLSQLLAAARATTTEAASRFHPDLDPAAFHIARWLFAFGPARTNDVARGVAMDRSAASRLIGRLRVAGLVRVEADPADRRANAVALTSSGRRHVARALEWKGGAFHDRLAAWSQADLAELARLLAILNHS